MAAVRVGGQPLGSLLIASGQRQYAGCKIGLHCEATRLCLHHECACWCRKSCRCVCACLFDVSLIWTHRKSNYVVPSYRAVWSCLCVCLLEHNQPWNIKKIIFLFVWFAALLLPTPLPLFNCCPTGSTIASFLSQGGGANLQQIPTHSVYSKKMIVQLLCICPGIWICSKFFCGLCYTLPPSFMYIGPIVFP